MTNDAKRTSQLGIVTTLNANDRVVVLTNPDSAAQTQTVSVNTVIGTIANALPIATNTTLGVVYAGPGISISANGQLVAPLPLATQYVAGIIKIGNNISYDSNSTISITLHGPYANDSNAASHSVSVGGLYYNSNGTVQIRLS